MYDVPADVKGAELLSDDQRIALSARLVTLPTSAKVVSIWRYVANFEGTVVILYARILADGDYLTYRWNSERQNWKRDRR